MVINYYYEQFKPIEDKNQCEWTKGILSGIPSIFGLPHASINEITCSFDLPEVLVRDYAYLGLSVEIRQNQLLVDGQVHAKRVALDTVERDQPLFAAVKEPPPLHTKASRTVYTGDWRHSEGKDSDAHVAWLVTHNLIRNGDVVLKSGQLWSAPYCLYEMKWRPTSVRGRVNEIIGRLNPFREQLRNEMERLLETSDVRLFEAEDAAKRERKAREQLELLNIQLEEKVRERTAQLTKSLDDLRAAQAMLIQSEKMASLGTLTAGIAHEINNPVASIARGANSVQDSIYALIEGSENVRELGLSSEERAQFASLFRTIFDNTRKAASPSTSEMRAERTAITQFAEQNSLKLTPETVRLLAELNLPPDDLAQFAILLNRYYSTRLIDFAHAYRQIVVTIQNIGLGADRITRIVQALKVYSHLDQAPVADVDIHEGIESTLTLLQHELKDGIEVVKKYSKVPRISCYPDELNQVWTNLIMNAVQAMEGKGTLTIETGVKEDKLVVRIRDTGPGIPESIRDRILEPFFTTKEPGKGTGLGLHICWKIVDRHGGVIGVEDTPRGTSVLVQLPVHREDERRTSTAS